MSCRIGFLVFFILSSTELKAKEPFLFFPTSTTKPITCHFCGYRYERSGNCHGAIDIDVDDEGTSIFAVASGKVTKVIKEDSPCEDQPYGIHLKLLHPNGYTTLYAHMLVGSVSLELGDTVKAGEQIGIGGNTGCSQGSHLHFETRDELGNRVDPFDAPWNHHLCVPDSTAPKDCGENSLWVQCPPVPYHEVAWNQDTDNDGYSIADGDCDDSSPFVHPGYVESCDYIDNDCDGLTDEDWPELGTACERGIGECTATGILECLIPWNSLSCTAEIGEPGLEICDGLDNDCDGDTDELPDALSNCSALIGAAGPCQDVTCDDGSCTLAPKWDGTPCTDGNACNGIEVCKDGLCSPGEGALCDDGLWCTVDSCDPDAGCVHIVETPEDWCNDEHPCTMDVLEEDCLCYYYPSAEPCQFNLCYEVGQCDGTEEWNCIQWTPIICDDFDPCTLDTCDPDFLGCQHQAIPGCP